MIQKEKWSDPNSPFQHCRVGNLPALRKYVKENGVGMRDACGGTIFHCAYMFQQYHICHWLVENYPLEALQPFSQVLFELFLEFC